MLAPGDTFGELAFLDDRPRSAAVRAHERTVVSLLPYAALRDLLTRRPDLAATFYRNATAAIIERLRSTTSDVAWLTAYVSGG
ncbi:MAG TPA: cyclic nucleotide-binding domain-containing protein [Candidatus Binatia bacterium]|nr:cyclic nucleotide-binding domain-containing protein [Candidatus Binatia bacterium]